MSYINLIHALPSVILQTEQETIAPHLAEDCYVWNDVQIQLKQQNDSMHVYLTAQQTPVCRVWLIWEQGVSEQARILGDAWERGYGDLEWRGTVPQRILPWYMLVSEDNGTSCYGIETGAASMCSWRADHQRIRLCIDIRNGGGGVVLNGRYLDAAAVVCARYAFGENTFDAACAFCKRMCPSPRLPDHPVYGGNNWYYAYGNSSATQILTDTQLMSSLTESIPNRPYVVIDDGWQISHSNSYNGGPWHAGNTNFPDMKVLADDMRAMNIHPGIWFRPLLTIEGYPPECILRKDFDGGCVLDPSHPTVLEDVERTTRLLSQWGYALIKHDFTTYDIYGRWGFDMGFDMTDGGWHFHDRSKTTAEIILGLYQAIRRGAGDQSIIIGCNTISHLAAGLFELQRTGDDTSGREWERTRKMGVNTLAHRMPQHNAFYAVDADCVGVTAQVDWPRTREWLRLLAYSGTPLFLSIDPAIVTTEQKEEIRAALQKCQRTSGIAVPLNWMDTTCPDQWRIQHETMTFAFPCEE